MNTVKINSPALPYWGNIPGNLFPGKVINVKGMFPVEMDPSSYSQINLCEGTKEIIAMHVSIRFKEHEVVRNSHKSGRWDREERGGPFPFEHGSQFWIQIIVQQDAYHISVNGQQCWTFAHRMPFLMVNAVNIEGPFQIFEVEYTDQTSMLRPGGCVPPVPRFPTRVDPGFNPGTCRPPIVRPGFNPYQPGGMGQPTPFLEPIYNPSVPFHQTISGGIHPGMMFYISGIPKPNFHRFSVNFQCGNAPYPPPDIAFHMDVRHFNANVVRNTRRDNKWGEEELVAPNFPFQPNVPFDMIIMVQNDKYMVAINGQHFAEYRHRLTLFSLINTFTIEDDITLTALRFAR